MSSKAQPFWRYFPACLLTTLAVAWAAVLLWSEIGWGEESLNFLETLNQGSRICFVIMAGGAFVLYLLDFFNPPHIKNRYCAFHADDKFPIGPVIVFGFVVLVLAACVMEADTYPWMPVLLTSFTIPSLFVVVYHCSGVNQLQHEEDAEDGAPGALEGAPKASAMPRDRAAACGGTQVLREKLQELNDRHWVEEEEQGFYSAAGASLVAGAVLLIAGWTIWITMTDTHFEGVEDASNTTARQKHIVMWVSPVVTALALIALAVLVGARLKFGELHKETTIRSPKAAVKEVGAPKRKHRVEVESLTEFEEATPEDYHHLMAKLQFAVKCFVCALVILVSGFYFMYLLAAEHRNLMLMVEAFLLLLFIHATAFLYISFRPVWLLMGGWLKDHPLLTTMARMAQSDWAKALGIFCLGPMLPLLLVVSSLNQLVRRYRRLPEPPANVPKEPTTSDLSSSRSCEEILEAPDNDGVAQEEKSPRHFFTTKVRLFLQDALRWDWTGVLPKTYIIGIAAVMYVLTPIMLNVCLSCMVSFLQPYPMSIIMIAVWLLGLLLFLLPPIPGAPVYLFSGVLVTGKACTDWGGIRGFWIGSALSILLCWVLKLSACAVQQQGIGAMLGTKDHIRKMVGVHKPFVRAIEAILRQRGMSFGKVVILCGGPDWPTSVLAGVLKLSLVQCEIGTMPIVVYIAPLSLTGSFYYKQDDGEEWRNAGALMFAVTAFMTIAMWVAMAWVVQQVFEKDQGVGELTNPKPEYEDLEWMDYRTEEISKICKKEWKEVPIHVRVAAVTGCVGLVLSAQAMFWNSSSFFADFEISDDVREFSLVGTGDQSLVTVSGLLVLTLAAFSCFGWLVLIMWTKKATEECRPQAEAVVDQRMQDWKEERLKKMDEAPSHGSSKQLPEQTEPNVGELLVESEQCHEEAGKSGASNSGLGDPLAKALGDSVQPLECQSEAVSGEAGSNSGSPKRKARGDRAKPVTASSSEEAAKSGATSSNLGDPKPKARGDRVKPLDTQPAASAPSSEETSCSPQSYGKPEEDKADDEVATAPLTGGQSSRKLKTTQPRQPSQKKAKPTGAAAKAPSEKTDAKPTAPGGTFDSGSAKPTAPAGNAPSDRSGAKVASDTAKPKNSDATKSSSSRPALAKQKTDGAQVRDGAEGSKKPKRVPTT